MMKKMNTILKNKKGSGIIELMLIVGGVLLIASLGVQTFKKSFNSVSGTVSNEIQNAQNVYNIN